MYRKVPVTAKAQTNSDSVNLFMLNVICLSYKWDESFPNVWVDG